MKILYWILARRAVRFAREILRDPFVDSVICETFEIQKMMGASLKKRGYNGWASKLDTED